MKEFVFFRRAAFLVESRSCMQGTINSIDEQKNFFTWSNLGKKFKLGECWQGMSSEQQQGQCQQASYWISEDFLKKILGVFSKRWKIFRTRQPWQENTCCLDKICDFCRERSREIIAGSKTSKAILTKCICQTISR